MKQRTRWSRFLHVGLMGIAVSLALAGLFCPVRPFLESLVQVVVACVGAAVGWMVGLRWKQNRTAPCVFASWTAAIAMVGVQALLGTPDWVLYGLIGLMAGIVVGAITSVVHVDVWLVPLSVLIGAVLMAVQARTSVQLTPALLWQVVSVAAIWLALLSSLAPNARMSFSGYAGALLLLLIGLWLWPWTALVRSGQRLHVAFWAWMIALGLSGAALWFVGWRAARVVGRRLWLAARWPFPFQIRPQEKEEPELHLEELVNEPDHCITASHVTAWIYGASHISHLVLAGHANSPICKEISAKLFGLFIDVEGVDLKDTLLVPGAFLMPVPKRVAKMPDGPVQELVDQLGRMQELTGLVRLCPRQPSNYDRVVRSLRRQIRRGMRSLKPVLLHRNDADDTSHAVYLPFYDLTSWALPPLRLELDLDLFKGSAFQDLLQAHRRELRYELISDAKRRKRIYEEWLERDTRSFHRLSTTLFQRVLPDAPHLDHRDLAESYSEFLLEAPPEQADSWVAELPTDIRSALIVTQSHRLHDFIQEHSPDLLPQEDEWKESLALAQQPEYPIYGSRNYAEATIEGGGTVSGYMSLQQIVELNQPGLIRSDREYIAKMDEILLKYEEAEPQREARIDAVNLGTLLDAFLRGWSPVFLPDQESRTRYVAWCKAQRQVVWEALQQQLHRWGMRMEPLQGDNVVFAVHERGAHRVQITPYYLATDCDLTVLVDREYGMTYYVNNWQYREMSVQRPGKADKRVACVSALRAGEKALADGRVSQASELFKRALRIHPVIGGEQILNGFWENTCRDTTAELDDMMQLVEGVTLFFSDREAARQKLRAFVERYPDFLPDPYLLEGYHACEAKTRVPALDARVDELVDEYNETVSTVQSTQDLVSTLTEPIAPLIARQQELIASLVASGVLEPQLDEWGNETGQYSVKGSGYFGYMYGLESAELQELNQIQQQIQEFDPYLLPMREQIKDDIARLEPLQKEIASAQRERDLRRAEVWRDLESQFHPSLARAMALDAEYTALVFRAKMFRTSIGFAQYVAPLHGLLKGKEYLTIERRVTEQMHRDGDLFERLENLGFAQQRQELDAICEVLVEQKDQVQYLESQETKILENLADFLRGFTQQLDSISRQSIRHALQDWGSDYARRAYKLYNEAADQVQHVTEVRRELCVCQHLLTLYQHALQTVVSGKASPLLTAFPQTQVKVINPGSAAVRSVALNAAGELILTLPNGETRPILICRNLTDAASRHLAGLVATKEYAAQIGASKLMPAYAMMLTPIAVPPLTRSWQAVLIDLHQWLLRVLAYAGVPPSSIQNPHREEVLAVFDRTPVVERVHVDPVKAREQFLHVVDPVRTVTQRAF